MERGLEGVQCSNGERNTKRKEGRSEGFTGTDVRGNSAGSGCREAIAYIEAMA
jgi:hypothetical protein